MGSEMCIRDSIPLGQSAGQKILINLIPVIQAQSMKYKNYDIKDIGSSAFISDLASMYHENLKNRIYQTWLINLAHLKLVLEDQ